MNVPPSTSNAHLYVYIIFAVSMSSSVLLEIIEEFDRTMHHVSYYSQCVFEILTLELIPDTLGALYLTSDDCYILGYVNNDLGNEYKAND